MQAQESIPRNVLVLADVDDSRYLDLSATSEHWNITTELLDFHDLLTSVDRIGRLAQAHETDFLLYSQNDQVAKRAGIGGVHQALGLGYSSFSPIDRGDEQVRCQQMRDCYEDFLHCGRSLALDISEKSERPKNKGAKGTFSLIFDTEQLGGIRYGVPRLLSLLAKYDIAATFFVTNLMDRVYTDLFASLTRYGHELAPHGLCHEHLAPLTVDEQQARLQAMIGSLSCQPSGANFIFRMNEDTITAFVRLGIRYFVFFDTNYYRLISYPKRSTRPTLLQYDEGDIWAVPISVQTYGLPWFSIKNMLDTAIMQGQRCSFEHISVLMHPFRDGSLNNIKTTERIILHLLEKGLEPITLAELETTFEERGSFTPGALDPYRMIETNRPPVELPTTRLDILGFLPQTAMSVLRRLTGKAIF